MVLPRYSPRGTVDNRDENQLSDCNTEKIRTVPLQNTSVRCTNLAGVSADKIILRCMIYVWIKMTGTDVAGCSRGIFHTATPVLTYRGCGSLPNSHSDYPVPSRSSNFLPQVLQLCHFDRSFFGILSYNGKMSHSG
jgi:hypothetical protein